MSRKIRKTSAFFSGVFCLVFLSQAFAAEWAPEGTRERKFQRGVLNTLLSPLEITEALHKAETKDALIPSWLTAGVGGIINMSIRIVTGSYEILTAPIPYPKDYRPIYQPELVIDPLLASPKTPA